MKLNFVTLAAVVIGWVIFIPLVLRLHLPWTPYRIAGAAVFVGAFILFGLARVQLGKSFSIEAKATRLVTTGLYSRIRNPIYVFGAAMLAGAILYSGKFWCLLIFLVLIPAQVHRSRREEQVLTEKFGTEYTEYKQKTWF